MAARSLPSEAVENIVRLMTICRRPSDKTVLKGLACVLGLIVLVVLYADTIGF
jgi:hypothetical protein